MYQGDILKVDLAFIVELHNAKRVLNQLRIDLHFKLGELGRMPVKGPSTLDVQSSHG
jgi:hypothetical protein